MDRFEEDKEGKKARFALLNVLYKGERDLAIQSNPIPALISKRSFLYIVLA